MIGIPLDAIPVTVSDEMMPTAWMTYDRKGRVVSCGALGMGSHNSSDEPAVRMTVGATVWEKLQALPRQSGRSV